MDDSIISITKLNHGVVKHEISKKKNHLISLFTSLEVKLADKKSKYFDKLQYLLTAWEQIVTFSETSTESPQPAFEFLFINTLRFVLRADWSRTSTSLQRHFSFILQRLGNVFARSEAYHSILAQCRVLESVVKNPWGHPVLGKLLNSQEVDLNECAEYFNFENGKVIVIRLEMLLLSKCEDIAIHLSKACLNTYTSFNEDLEGFDTLDFTQDEIDYITDIYFSSLLKTKKKTELITEIKKYQLDDGLRLLQRYRAYGVGGKHNEFCKNARVWKCNRKLIDLLSNTLLANAVLHEDLLESQSQLEDLISEWAAVQTTNDVLPPLALEMIRKFVLIAPSSKCIYPFCSFLIRNVSCKEQDFNQVARCLIRAINQNMNEIEQFRVNQERDKLKETYSQLSKGFLLISELFNECKNICKECLLTSFSLTPSRECLQIIEAFVEKLSNSIEESESSECTPQEQPAPDPTTETPPETDKVHDTSELNEIFQSMGVANEKVKEEIDSSIIAKQADSKRGLAPAYIAEVENLKVEDSICEDLNCIIRYQRYHTLSWDLSWDELRSNCEQYLEFFETKGFDDVELKYLDLDYNQFKDQPINYDECYGIEKGYEQYAFSPEESEEEYSSTRRSGLSSYDSDDEIIISHKKRKKILSSDSEEPRVKKKRGRKPKIRDPDDPGPRRNSSKKKSDLTDEDILDNIENQSDPNSLKALRQFRITGLKSLNMDDGKQNVVEEKITKEVEELNSILEDSFKQLESVEIPPVSPRFNVYDVILSETLMPSNNEIPIPSNNQSQPPNPANVVINGTFTPEPQTSVKPKPEKRNLVSRERNPTKRKPKGEPKPPKTANNRLKNVNESYLGNGTFTNGTYPTLLSNNDLFKRKYGSKPKNGHTDENNPKECMVQLPNLNQTLNQAHAMKSFDQNGLYSAYSNYSYLGQSIKPEDAWRMLNGNFQGLENIQIVPGTPSPPQMALKTSEVSDEQFASIENLLSQMDGPYVTQNTNIQKSNPPVVSQAATESRTDPPPNGLNDTKNDINQALLDFVIEQLPNYPNSRIYASPTRKPPVTTTMTFSTTSKLVSTSPQMTPNSSLIMSSPQNSFVRTTKKKRESKKVSMVNGHLVNAQNIQNQAANCKSTTTVVPSPQLDQNAGANDLYATFARAPPKENVNKVDQILDQYRVLADKYPQLVNVPAPRKRTVPSASRKPRARTKKNTQVTLTLEEALNKDSLLDPAFNQQSSVEAQGNVEPVSYVVSSNVYCNNSKSELPISSVSTASQMPTTLQYQRTTGTQTKAPEQTYVDNQIAYGTQTVTQPVTNYVSSPKMPAVQPNITNYVSPAKMPAIQQNCTNYVLPPKMATVQQTIPNYVSPPKTQNDSGTLKALLMQGPANSNVSKPKYESMPYYSESSNATQIQLQMPVSTNETVSFTNAPKTYGYTTNKPQSAKMPNQYALVNTQVPSNIGNVTVRIPKLRLSASTVPLSNGQVVEHYSVVSNLASSTTTYTSGSTNQQYALPTSSATFAANVPQNVQQSNADLMKDYASMMNNFEIKIPRIDLKFDQANYKPNFYSDQANAYATSKVENVKVLNGCQVVLPNILDCVNQSSQSSLQELRQYRNSALKLPDEVNDDRIAGQMEEFNSILESVNPNSQFATAVTSSGESKNEMKVPIMYAITEMNSANEVQLSIPECGFNFEDYLSCFQQST